MSSTIPTNPPRKQAARTATKNNSIWHPIQESTFRRTIVALARQTNGVPTDPSPGVFGPAGQEIQNGMQSSQHTGVKANQSQQQHLLSLELEFRLASDFAFLAATEEGVKSVAAACLEEHVDTGTLTLRLAANEGAPSLVQRGLEEIWEAAVKSAQECDIQVAREQIFDSILRLCGDRVLARMRLAVGRPPGFVRSRQPGRPAGTALARMQREATSSAGRELAEKLQSLIPDFVDVVLRSESSSASMDIDVLKEQIKRCYKFTTSDSKMVFKDVLQAAGLVSEEWLNSKEVMQIEKIGAYWRIARGLAKECRRAPLRSQLQKLDVQAVSPYEPVSSSISLENRTVSCFVHAEVQLIVHYLLRGHIGSTQPRVIGASKSVCFLCGLLIKSHGRFCAPAGHGRLYDQWTMPDLASFDQLQLRLMRKIVQEMHKTMSGLLASPKLRRPYPLTSRQHLLELPLSSADASSSSTIRPVLQSQAVNAVAQIAKDSHENKSGELEIPTEVQDRPSQNQVSRNSCEELGASIPEEATKAGASTNNLSHGGWKTISDTRRCVEAWRESNLNIFLEVECPSKARYRLMSQSSFFDWSPLVVQIRDLKVDQEVSLVRPTSQNVMKFCFQDASAIHIGVELEWTLPPSQLRQETEA